MCDCANSKKTKRKTISDYKKENDALKSEINSLKK